MNPEYPTVTTSKNARKKIRHVSLREKQKIERYNTERLKSNAIQIMT